MSIYLERQKLTNWDVKALLINTSLFGFLILSYGINLRVRYEQIVLPPEHPRSYQKTSGAPIH